MSNLNTGLEPFKLNSLVLYSLNTGLEPFKLNSLVLYSPHNILWQKGWSMGILGRLLKVIYDLLSLS